MSVLTQLQFESAEVKNELLRNNRRKGREITKERGIGDDKGKKIMEAENEGNDKER